MNGILYMDVSVFEDVLLYEKGKTLLSAERRMYIEKLKNPKTARLSLGAGVLLFFALQKCNYTEQLEKIKKTPLGKPYLKGIDFQFNLSHSGTYRCGFTADKREASRKNRKNLVEGRNIFSDKIYAAGTNTAVLSTLGKKGKPY